MSLFGDSPSFGEAPLARAFMIAAPKSGSGKTVVTIGLQRAFARRGLRVAGAKSGPDYIDPAFAGAACGRPSVNLDGFAMSRTRLAGLAAAAARGADLLIAEGAMGLFDGVAGSGLAAAPGSSAALAGAFGWPVVLVLDGRGAAQTLAALAHGLASFPDAPLVAGAIVNRVASPRHRRMIEAGFRRIATPLLGCLPADERLALPSRHLGLVQAHETAALDERLDAMADVLAAHCDLPAIAACAVPVQPAPLLPVRPPGQRIAVARDEAFSFLYPHLLDGWRAAGAEIAVFSPLADEAPPPCDICWLPGGYPELHAGRLAANGVFLDGLRRLARTTPIHGECGGYMVLGRSLEGADGTRHAMAGLLPVDTSFAQRRLHLGYRRATWRSAMPFADRGETAIGHEYHHATLVSADGEALADVQDGEGQPLPPAGTRSGHVTGTFFHLVA